jgi:hypothetical protein
MGWSIIFNSEYMTIGSGGISPFNAWLPSGGFVNAAPFHALG